MVYPTQGLTTLLGEFDVSGENNVDNDNNEKNGANHDNFENDKDKQFKGYNISDVVHVADIFSQGYDVCLIITVLIIIINQKGILILKRKN